MRKNNGSNKLCKVIKRKWMKRALILVVTGIAVVGLYSIGTNYMMIREANLYIMDTVKEAGDKKAEAIIVLGAYVKHNGNPSDILRDRLDTAYEMYCEDKNLKILVTGDHGQTEYDEVNAMKEYLEAKGVPTSQIFMDHAGFSTYESMYRAKDIFEVNRAIVITQDYHLKRAIYLARKKGIEAYGVKADKRIYHGIRKFASREVLARVKDFTLANVLKPKPKYLGDKIPIMTSDSSLTYDKKKGEKAADNK